MSPGWDTPIQGMPHQFGATPQTTSSTGECKPFSFASRLHMPQRKPVPWNFIKTMGAKSFAGIQQQRPRSAVKQGGGHRNRQQYLLKGNTSGADTLNADASTVDLQEPTPQGPIPQEPASRHPQCRGIKFSLMCSASLAVPFSIMAPAEVSNRLALTVVRLRPWMPIFELAPQAEDRIEHA